MTKLKLCDLAMARSRILCALLVLMLSALGNASWTVQWNVSVPNMTGSNQVAVADTAGVAYAFGGVGSVSATLWAFSTSTGSLLWTNTLSPGGALPCDLASDGTNAYIVGVIPTPGSSTFNIASYSSSGTLRWQTNVSLASNIGGALATLALDGSGGLYLVGNTAAPSGSPAYATVLKLNASTGAVGWGPTNYNFSTKTVMPRKRLFYSATTGSLYAPINLTNSSSVTSGYYLKVNASTGTATATSLSCSYVYDMDFSGSGAYMNTTGVLYGSPNSYLTQSVTNISTAVTSTISQPFPSAGYPGVPQNATGIGLISDTSGYLMVLGSYTPVPSQQQTLWIQLTQNFTGSQYQSWWSGLSPGGLPSISPYKSQGVSTYFYFTAPGGLFEYHEVANSLGSPSPAATHTAAMGSGASYFSLDSTNTNIYLLGPNPSGPGYIFEKIQR